VDCKTITTLSQAFSPLALHVAQIPALTGWAKEYRAFGPSEHHPNARPEHQRCAFPPISPPPNARSEHQRCAFPPISPPRTHAPSTDGASSFSPAQRAGYGPGTGRVNMPNHKFRPEGTRSGGYTWIAKPSQPYRGLSARWPRTLPKSQPSRAGLKNIGPSAHRSTIRTHLPSTNGARSHQSHPHRTHAPSTNGARFRQSHPPERTLRAPTVRVPTNLTPPNARSEHQRCAFPPISPPPNARSEHRRCVIL